MEVEVLPSGRVRVELWLLRDAADRRPDLVGLSDDVEWINYKAVPGYNDEMPWIGTRHGPAEVLASFQTFISVCQPHDERLIKLAVDGDEAAGVIAEQGIQNLSLSEIESRTGMSRGQLTYYFKAKEDILLAVFDRMVRRMRERPCQAAYVVLDHRRCRAPAAWVT